MLKIPSHYSFGLDLHDLKSKERAGIKLKI
jgi:hypothetical protein